MPESGKGNKPRYEAPVVVALGGLARGAGYCRAGSSASDGDCTAGVFASSYCTAGGAAATACSDGGTAVTAACVTGTVPGA